MGNGASLLVENEVSKPVDSSDLKNEAEARAEVTRLRTLLAENQELVKNSQAKDTNTSSNSTDTNQSSSAVNPRPNARASIVCNPHAGLTGQEPMKVNCKSPHNVDFSKFERGSKSFKMEDAPTMKDYLVNEFHRFCGKDEVLEWDEFWRLMKDLNLGLSDLEIGQLRQRADINHDGVVDWIELLAVIEPLVGKIWQAKLEHAPEFEKYCELHWETHHKVKKDKEGFTKKGDPFWVNKITGETNWEMPEILKRHSSIEKERAERNLQAAPDIQQFLTQAFQKHSKHGQPLSYDELWKLVKEDLVVSPPISEAEMKSLMEISDFDKNNMLDLNEFLLALSPYFQAMFEKREVGGDWVTLSHIHEDGHEYLYWYNRVTGKSTWDNPTQKKRSSVSQKKRASLANNQK